MPPCVNRLWFAYAPAGSLCRDVNVLAIRLKMLMVQSIADDAEAEAEWPHVATSPLRTIGFPLIVELEDAPVVALQ